MWVKLSGIEESLKENKENKCKSKQTFGYCSVLNIFHNIINSNLSKLKVHKLARLWSSSTI